MKIAIVKLSALGDIVHAMVALQFIKKHYPDSQIDWVVEEGFKGVLENNPDIDKIHTVNLKKAKQNKSLKLLFQELKSLRKFPNYDIVIDAQGLIKSAIIARAIPSNKTFGFNKSSLRESIAANLYTDTCNIDYSENIIKRNMLLISKALNFDISHTDILNKKPFLYSNPNTVALDDNLQPNIAFVPGASFRSKIYPIEKYIELANNLDANIVVLWGNLEEKLMAEKIQNRSKNVKVSKQLTLDELKAFISQTDLVIGGDTGPTHMAWGLNTPSITLFGSTPGYRNTYMTDINIVLESASKVNPSKINKNDFSIRSIEVNIILENVKKLLELV